VSFPERAQASGVAVVQGDAYLLDRAGWGRVVGGFAHGFATRELGAVAGSSQVSATNPAELAELLREAAEGMLGAAASWTRGTSLELRYVTEPSSTGPTRIRLALTVKAINEAPDAAVAVAEAAADAACAALPEIYEWRRGAIADFEPTSDELLFIEIRRQEEVTPPLLASVDTEFYYAVHPLMGDGNGWRQFLEHLARVRESVAVSILFVPTSLDPDEQAAMGAVATALRFHGTQRQELNILGQMVNVPADANAAAFAPLWERYVQELRHCLLVRMSVQGPGAAARAVAQSLAAALSISRADVPGRTQLTTQALRDEEDVACAAHSWSFRDVVPWGGHPIWRDATAPHSLRRLPYLYSLSEAAAAAVLPVPDAQGAPGFVRARRFSTRRTAIGGADDGPDIALGDLMHAGEALGEARIPLSAINRHTLVVGAPGSGKTTTVLSLLARLWREHQVPFLAIEPTKTEYRSLLNVSGMQALRVVTLGRDDVAPLRLNPLAPPDGVRCEVHMSSVMAAFRAALPLDPPLPQLLEDALERAYSLAGWSSATTMADGRRPPTLRDLLAAYEQAFAGGEDDLGYSGDVRGNLLAALRLRLRSLTRGSRGLLLDTVESVYFAELMRGPVVIELDEIADRDDKAILAAFLLDRIQAAARARGSTDGKLKHVTVLEEAHRLLGRVGDGLAETPQSAAIRSFCDAIAELRARGEGFIISSQSPSALAEAAVANTGTRILHRLESSADRDVVLADLDASDLDREAAARLAQGEAIVRWPQLDEAEVVTVRAADGINSGSHVSNGDVALRMQDATAEVRRLMPYRLCTREVCRQGCDPAVRARGDEIADDLRVEVRAIWAQHAGTASALAPICERLAAVGGESEQLTYCAAAHLAARGSAFVVPRKDIRPQVASAVRLAVRR
jgi:Helicase HerA, central domain